MADLLADLNPEQSTAVVYADGPLLVVAGPGTGKTRVITHRIAHRVATGTLPERVLGITFTHRAAAEMQSRVAALLGEQIGVRMGTFHWMCNALLRRYADRIGYPRDFRLLTPGEARSALRRVVLQTWPQEQHRSGRIAAAISARKNGARAEAAAMRYGLAGESIEPIHRAYADTLRSARALDLDDLLYLTVRLLREDEHTRESCRSWYREIVVDEFQDTNPVQQQLLSLLAPPDGSIVAVGDEDQAIYGWRQADSRGMHRFLEDFPTARVVRLTQSYRSTKHILRAAGTLIAHNPERLAGELRTDNPAGERLICIAADDEVDEAEQIAMEIERLTARGETDPADIAVLYRINAQSRALEDAFVRRRIAYQVHAGARFYERPEIRRAVAYLRLVLGEDDDAAACLASDVPGIGARRLELLRESARVSGMPLLSRFSTPIAGLPHGSIARLREISDRVLALRAMREEPLSGLVSAAADAAALGIDSIQPGDLDSVAENLDELRSVARELSARHATLRDFVDRLSFTGNEAGGGGVRLMTLHAAKGLEFRVVFVAGVEDGLLPHRRSLERGEDVAEERRLFYVGMTRARQRLYLSYAHARMLAGSQTLGGASRFVGEIGPASLELRVSPRRRARPRLSSTYVGERVVHARWGPGTVTAVEGAGRDTLVTIRFDGAGQQRLQLCHAPLTRDGGEMANVAAG